MSRTYRRKNIEDTLGDSRSRAGRKLAGIYTKREYNWRARTTLFRPMTATERFCEWYWLHGESRHNNERTPNRWYRQRRCRQARRHNKRELQQYLFNPNYEPMVDRKDRSHLWDWR